MREVGRNAVLGSFTTAGGSLVGFVLRFGMSAVLARFLAPEDFGTYAQAAVYATLVALLGAFSFPQALMQLPDMPALHATVTRFTALTALAMLALGAVLAPLVGLWRGADVAWCFMGLSFGHAVSAFGGTYEGDLLRRHRWHAAAALRLGVNVLTVAFVVPIGVVWSHPLVLVLRDVMTPVLLIAIMAFVRWRMRAATPRDAHEVRRHRDTTRAVWSLGAALFWNRGLEMLLHKVDSALVGELLGQRALGYYDQARYLAGVPSAFVGPVTNLVGLPLIASLHDDPARRTRAFVLLQWGVTRLMFGFALGCLVAPELALRLLFGPQWEPSAPYLQILSLWCIVVPVSTAHQILLTATQAWRPIRIGFVSAIVVVTATLGTLVPLWDARGAAVATTLAMTVELVVRARATSALVGQRARDTLRLALPIVLALVVGGVVGRLVTAADDGLGVQVAGLAAGLAAGGGVLVALELGQAREHLGYLRDLIRRRRS